jgi:LSU ribosomal protein L33P
VRTKITLACTECKNRNYNMTKDKKLILTGWKPKSIADSARPIRYTKKPNKTRVAKE